jgi:hypothetical protein
MTEGSSSVHLMSYTEGVLCQVYCKSPVRILVGSIRMLWSTGNVLCEMWCFFDLAELSYVLYLMGLGTNVSIC